MVPTGTGWGRGGTCHLLVSSVAGAAGPEGAGGVLAVKPGSAALSVPGDKAAQEALEQMQNS